MDISWCDVVMIYLIGATHFDAEERFERNDK
jgi:hypothetical protein